MKLKTLYLSGSIQTSAFAHSISLNAHSKDFTLFYSDTRLLPQDF